MTPTEWLMEAGDREGAADEVPSLDDVRKALSFQIADAESLSSNRRSLEDSPLTRNRQLSNQTARSKYTLHQSYTGRKHTD